MEFLGKINLGLLVVILILGVGQASEKSFKTENRAMQPEMISKVKNYSITQAGNVWYVYRDGANPVHYTEIYRVEGDTLINDQTWKILSFTTEPDDADNQNWQTRFYLLQTESKIFCALPDDLSPKLYFDISLQKDSIVELYCPFWKEHSMVRITKVDTVNIKGIERKRFYSEIKSNFDDELWFENPIWIEGIGSENGIFYGNAPPIVGSQYDLTCFHVDDVLYYPENLTGSCFLSNVGVEPIPRDAALMVYPNPTEGIVNIRSTDLEPYTFISLGTLDGAMSDVFPVSQGNNTLVLDLKPLQPGVYILRIRDKHGIFQAVKVIKY